MLPKWVLPIVGVIVFSVACTPATQRPPMAQRPTTNAYDNSLYVDRTTGIDNRFTSYRNQTGTGTGTIPYRYGYRGTVNPVVRGQNEVGFSSFTPDDFRTRDGVRVTASNLQVNRNALANQIGYLVTTYPQVRKSTVLVTDDRVFVGIDDIGKKLDAATVEKVRKSALAITPRYYRVHVTTDKQLHKQMTKIGRKLANGGTVTQYRDDLSALLRKMGDPTPVRSQDGRINMNNRTPITPSTSR
ncbi:YhcN/YlaJ family sporulation lipoprotein [Numidum massiliense]|uniref:YhcN/YlaJ family sporulation lipoprotein n=1 Tax=Numidum massiliense TaxID=1522315 RepID=UPI0006D5B34A|nr:YhcN/YlaJ family sporulation lipoprotein [Numidum massiliense]